MRLAEWMRFFQGHRDKKLFSLADLSQMTDVQKPLLLVQLSRLEKAGIVERPVRGWYMNPFSPPTPEEIAVTIRFPSYLSLEYALAKHSVLSQFPYTLTLVTTRLPYTIRTPQIVYEYHQITRRLFGGYRYEGDIPVAEPEKALLDLVYIRHLRTREFSNDDLASLLDDMHLDELDSQRLAAYAARHGPTMERVLATILNARLKAVRSPRRRPWIRVGARA